MPEALLEPGVDMHFVGLTQLSGHAELRGNPDLNNHGTKKKMVIQSCRSHLEVVQHTVFYSEMSVCSRARRALAQTPNRPRYLVVTVHNLSWSATSSEQESRSMEMEFRTWLLKKTLGAEMAKQKCSCS